MSRPTKKTRATNSKPKVKPEDVREKLFSPNWQTFGGSILGTYDAFGGQREPTKAELVRAFDDIVYSAAQLIASALINVKIRLYVKTASGQQRPKCATKQVEKKALHHVMKAKALAYDTTISEVVEHPLLDLLDKVNPFHNRLDLLELTQLYLDVTGNSYWFIGCDDFGLPTEIYLLPSQCMEPERDEKLIVRAWKYHEGNETKIYDPKDIIHFKYPNLRDPYCEGYSPVRAAWQRVMIGWKELGYLDNTLTNNARPDAVLSPQNEISPFEAERLAKDFGHRFRASGNGGIFIADGPMKLDTINWPPKDLAELELYKVVKTSVLNCFHIPIELFEIGEANRSTAEAALYSLATNCIQPRVLRLVEKLNEKLIPYYDDRLFFCADAVVPEDKDFDMRERDMLLKNGVITRAEARRLYGFDAEDWADEPLIPSGMLPTGSGEPALNMATSAAPTSPLIPEKPAEAAGQAGGGDAANELRATVGGSQQVLQMQQAVIAGLVTREMAIANARIVFGFTDAEAEALFPEMAPVKVAPAEAPPAPPQKAQTTPRFKAKALDIPDVRQSYPYDCGAAATMAVCSFFKVGPQTEAEYVEALGTNEDEGTEAPRIVAYLQQVGLTVEARDGLTVKDLATFTSKGSPVIVAIQDYGGIQEEEQDQSGHYVVVCDVAGDTITLQDPSAGRVEVKADDFLNNWHDEGEKAEGPYSRYGIAVSKKAEAKPKATTKALIRPLTEKSPEPLVKALKGFFARQKAAIIDHTKGLAEAETKALPAKGFFDLAAWTQEMFDEMLPVVEIYYDHAAQQTVSRLGGDVELLKVVQPNLKEGVAKATLLFCQTTNEATSQDLTKALDDLRAQIAEGLESGDVKNAMKDRVQAVFDGLDNERAYAIGHTEASRAQHNAMMITAKESGVAKAKRWILSSDACPQCKPLAGKTVPLDEPFETDGAGPYAAIDGPPRHPLCRCAMALVVEGVND